MKIEEFIREVKAEASRRDCQSRYLNLPKASLGSEGEPLASFR